MQITDARKGLGLQHPQNLHYLLVCVKTDPVGKTNQQRPIARGLELRPAGDCVGHVGKSIRQACGRVAFSRLANIRKSQTMSMVLPMLASVY